MAFSRTSRIDPQLNVVPPPLASPKSSSSNSNGGSGVTPSLVEPRSVRKPPVAVARKPRLADILPPKKKSQPPPPPSVSTHKKKEKKGRNTQAPHFSIDRINHDTDEIGESSGGDGGDDDDDGDDDIGHGGGDDGHDEGPYIFQASRPKDAPQYRMNKSRFNLRPSLPHVEQISKSIFNHRGGIRMDMITGAMLQLGWTEDTDAESPAFDLQWSLSAKHLQRDKLKPKQIVNHLQGIGCVTTKIQLCKNARSLVKPHGDTFFPRCYAICESKEFDAFVKQYQTQAAISILIKYINLSKHHFNSPSTSSSSSSSVSSPSSSSPPDPSSSTSSSATDENIPLIPPLFNRTMISLCLHAIQSHLKKMRYSPLARDQSWKDKPSTNSSSSSSSSSSSTPVSDDNKTASLDSSVDDKVSSSPPLSSPSSKNRSLSPKRASTSVYRRSNDLSRVEWKEIVKCAESIRLNSQPRKSSQTTETKTVPTNNNGNATASDVVLPPPSPTSSTPSTSNGIASSGNTSTPTISPSAPSTSGSTDNNLASPTSGGVPPKTVRQASARPGVTRQASSKPSSTMDTSITLLSGPLFDDKLVSQVQSCLDELHELDPQCYYNGEYNVWILKPGTQSRGRGIQVCDSLAKIVKDMRADVSGRWVIQKYLERPLAIHRKKFDIRQWMVVTQFGNCMRAWFYEDCYLRFSSQDFDLSDLSGGIHLTNNAIQAKLKDFDTLHEFGAKGNMWSMHQFAQWLETKFGPTEPKLDPLVEGGGEDGLNEERKKYSVWHYKLRPKMRAVAQAVMQMASDKILPRSHSFEIYGLDFMFDENLQPWLLEVNSAPTLMHIAVDALVDTMCLDMLTVVLADHHRMIVEEANEAAEKAKAEAAAAAATSTSSNGTSGTNRRGTGGAGNNGPASPTNKLLNRSRSSFNTPATGAKKTLIGRQSSKGPVSPNPSSSTSSPLVTVPSSSPPSDTKDAPSIDALISGPPSSNAPSTSTPSSTSSSSTSSTAPIPTTSTLGSVALPGSKFRLIWENRLNKNERASKKIARIRAFRDNYNADRLALTQPGTVRVPGGHAAHLL